MMAGILVGVEIEPVEEGGHLATSDEWQGLVAQGCTGTETIEIAQDVARQLIESHVEHGDPLSPKVRTALKRRQKQTMLKIPGGVEPKAVKA